MTGYYLRISINPMNEMNVLIEKEIKYESNSLTDEDKLVYVVDLILV